MNFKKVLFLAIFSAALEQNTFSVAAEPSQKAEAKTTVTSKKEKTKVRRALEIFGVVVGLAAVITGIVYRDKPMQKYILKLFKSVEKDKAEKTSLADNKRIVHSHKIIKQEDDFYTKDQGTLSVLSVDCDKKVFFLQKEQTDKKVYFIKNGGHLLIGRDRRLNKSENDIVVSIDDINYSFQQKP